MSPFLSFMRDYLDPVFKADQCAQYVDENGIAANKSTDLIRNIRAFFQFINQAGLKLTKEKCHFGESLAGRFHQKEFHPNLGRFKLFSTNSDSQNPKRTYSAIWDSYTTTEIWMAEKPSPFYTLLKAEMPINITSELKDTFD